MANPTWITSENVKFNGTLDNAAVLDTTTNVRSLVLWDDLSLEDQGILTKFVNDNGGALPLVGPTAGQQLVDFLSAKNAGDATGLSNVASATAAVATVNIGGNKIAADASGLSSAQGTHGMQVANFDATLVGGTVTNLVPTAGYQEVQFSAAITGGTATNYLADSAGYQDVNTGGTNIGSTLTGLADVKGKNTVTFSGAVVGAIGLAPGNFVFDVQLDAELALTTYTVALLGTSTMADVASAMQVQLDNHVAGITVTTDNTVFVVTSATAGATSKVIITTNLGADLFGAIDTAKTVTHTFAEVDGSDVTYTASIAIDAAAHTRSISLTGTQGHTYTDLIAQLISQSGSWYTAALVNGNIRITSLQPGATSDIVITDTNLFSSLTNKAANPAGVTGTHPTYTSTVTVGVTPHVVTLNGSDIQTFTTLVSQLDAALNTFADVTLDTVNNRIKITTVAVGTGSVVSIAAGTLFAAPLNFYQSIRTAVAGLHSTAALLATVVVDGVTKNISILPAAIATFADVINEINTDLGASAVASISGGDIKITSASYGVYSTVTITDVTLFAALPSFLDLLPVAPGGGISRTYSATAVVDGTHVRPINFTGLAGDTLQHVLDEINADLNVAAAVGYQDVKFGVNRAATYSTGLANAGTVYTATVVLDGGSRAISVVGSAAQTYTALLSEIQTDLDVGGVIAVASLVNGKLRIASTTVSSASTVAITDTGTHPLFESLSYFLEIAPAVVGNDLTTYATASISGGNIIITSNTTGFKSAVDLYDNGFLFNRLTGYVGITTVPGVAPTIYTANARVDGVNKDVSVQGSAAQTFTTLINEINTDLGVAATAALTTPVAGYQNVLFSAVKIGANASGLTNDGTAYTASVLVDGVAKPISVVGSAAQTFTTVLSEINTDLGASGAVTINADGGLVVTSATTGIASSVVITDGVTHPLFGTLTNYASLAAPQHGVGSDIKITSATTGVASTVSITDGTLFKAAGARGINPGIVGIVNMLAAAKLQKSVVGMPVADHFDVFTVGLNPSSLWSIDHVPVKANIPKVPQFTYYGTDGKWKFLADDTNVNP